VEAIGDSGLLFENSWATLLVAVGAGAGAGAGAGVDVGAGAGVTGVDAAFAGDAETVDAAVGGIVVVVVAIGDDVFAVDILGDADVDTDTGAVVFATGVGGDAEVVVAFTACVGVDCIAGV